MEHWPQELAVRHGLLTCISMVHDWDVSIRVHGRLSLGGIPASQHLNQWRRNLSDWVRKAGYQVS